MVNKTSLIISNNSIIETVISWFFGVLFLAIGLINTFWGNDPQFGIFIVLLSLIYFVPVDHLIKKVTGFSIPRMSIIKIVTAAFIIWASVGVGELFDKIEIMKRDW